MIKVSFEDLCKKCPMDAEANVEYLNPCGNGECLEIKYNWHKAWRKKTKEAVFLSEVARKLKFRDDYEEQDIFDIYQDVSSELTDMSLDEVIEKTKALILKEEGSEED